MSGSIPPFPVRLMPRTRKDLVSYFHPPPLKKERVFSSETLVPIYLKSAGSKVITACCRHTRKTKTRQNVFP